MGTRLVRRVDLVGGQDGPRPDEERGMAASEERDPLGGGAAAEGKKRYVLQVSFDESNLVSSVEVIGKW